MWPFTSSTATNHYAPHLGVSFEGYYNKFRLPSGASVALIISAVPGAARAASSSDERPSNRKAFMISFTYVSPTSEEYWQREYFPERFDVQLHRYRHREGSASGSGGERGNGKEGEGGFTISWDTGEFSWFAPSPSDSHGGKGEGAGEDTVRWRLKADQVSFTAQTIGEEEQEQGVQRSVYTEQGEDGELRRRAPTGARAGAGRRTPWRPDDPTSTPAGFMANLPLPIQWHVHSVDSLCSFSLSIDPSPSPSTPPTSTTFTTESISDEAGELGSDRKSITERKWRSTFPSPSPSGGPGRPTSFLPLIDQQGLANVHIEKNWAHSFPPAYIWLQARDHETQSGINVAGGTLIPGVQAYLLGYQAPPNGNGQGDPATKPSKRFISFKPPTSTFLPFVSFGLSSVIDYAERRIALDIRGWFTRLRISAACPNPTKGQKETFFTFAAPLSTGHAPNYCTQSFGASVTVQVWQKKWWALWMAFWPLSGLGVGWDKVSEQVFERGSLEFGGGFYRDDHED